MGIALGLFFVALAAVELYTLSTRAFTLNGFRNSGKLIGTSACFGQEGFKSYPWLGTRLNQINCTLNSVFTAVHKSRDAELFMSVFGSVLLSALVVSGYESFRRRSGLLSVGVRAASLFVLWGQKITAGFAMPLYLALCCWSPPDRRPGPDGAHAWSALLAALGGYLGPTLYAVSQEWSYPALSIWQPFPVYILILNLILPRVLPNVARTTAVVTSTILCCAVSASSHFELINRTLLTHENSLAAVFMPTAEATLTYASHFLLLIDFFSVVIAYSVFILARGRPGAITGKLVAFVLATVAFGPGAGIIVAWAYTEVGKAG